MFYKGEPLSLLSPITLINTSYCFPLQLEKKCVNIYAVNTCCIILKAHFLAAHPMTSHNGLFYVPIHWFTIQD